MNIEEIFDNEKLNWMSYTVADDDANSMLDRLKKKVTEYVDELKKRIADLESQVPKVVATKFTGTLGYQSCTCGQGMRIGSRFCANCGAKLNWECEA